MHSVLKSLNVKYLRYPGGEKSDNYLWAMAPWTKAAPVVARPGSKEWPSGDARFTRANSLTLKSHVLDFDEFMALCQSVGAEPVLVVAYDGMYKKAASVHGLIPKKEQLLRNAEEWVRYANIKKGYGVKYWMIGNESYKSCEYNGCATAEQYRDDVVEFARRMKKVDPSIQIIANGESDDWWSTVLPTAAAHIDFLGLSNYPVWKYAGGYDYYRKRNPDFLKVVNTAASAIQRYAPAEDRERLKIIVTEFNTIDWSDTWENKNDLGHALLCFEMLGEHLKKPIIHSAIFWNTRWVSNTSEDHQVSDAVDKEGRLQANGKALAIWGNYLLKQMISTRSVGVIRTFASLDRSTRKLNVFLINKEKAPRQANVFLLGFPQPFSGRRWEFTGNGADDVSPAMAPRETINTDNPVLSLRLPATSITVLELRAL
jgi:alpha-L-arabinofuranosidase